MIYEFVYFNSFYNKLVLDKIKSKSIPMAEEKYVYVKIFRIEL
jgi:hypothetical protein